VADGRVAALDGEDTPVVRFRSNNRETIVAATNCEARFAEGGSAGFRGARQGSAVTVGDRSTVGTFEAQAGDVALSCGRLPAGRPSRSRASGRGA
jgi:hypothetical protein